MVRLLCVMMMNCECDEEPLQDADEAVDVRFVERRVQFVQHAERTGLDLVNREQQRHGGHRLLAAGQQRDALQLFAGRARHDVNAALQHVVLVRQNQVRLAAAEDLDEHRAEIVADFLERLHEHLPRLHVDAVDDFEQLRLGRDQIVVLLGQELIALLGLLVFLDGHQIHRADFVEPLSATPRPAAPRRSNPWPRRSPPFPPASASAPWPGLRRRR